MSEPNGDPKLTEPDQISRSALVSELKTLRLRGLAHAREVPMTNLRQASAIMGLAVDNVPIVESLRELIDRAIVGIGEGRDALVARHTFGLIIGTKLRGASDRRRAAANAQGVSVERFRKGYEPYLIEQIADEILTLVARKAMSSEKPSKKTVSQAVVNRPMQVTELLRSAHSLADWTAVAGIYSQIVDIAKQSSELLAGMGPPETALQMLAEALYRVNVPYRNSWEEYLQHVLAVIANVEKKESLTPAVLNTLYKDERFNQWQTYTGTEKRRPKPLEAIVETVRRMHEIDSLSATFGSRSHNLVLGGSLMYSPHLSVRGATRDAPGSDIDVVLLIPSYECLEEFSHLMAGRYGHQPDASRSFIDRAQTFSDQGFDDGRTFLSHKFPAGDASTGSITEWIDEPPSYSLDLRIMSSEVLAWLLVDDGTRIGSESTGKVRSIREFAATRGYASSVQLSFSGRSKNVPVIEEGVNADGCLQTYEAYHINAEDQYFLGVHQQLILPALTKPGLATDLGVSLDNFRWKLSERLRRERAQRPYEDLSLTNSHPRQSLFARHIERTLNLLN